MAEVATVARPYAEAIFALADKAGKLADWSVLLKNLAATAGDARVSTLLANPNVSVTQLTDLFMAVGQDGLGADAKSFVQTLAENRRLAALAQIQGQFETLKNEREKAVDAHIASAFPLEPAKVQPCRWLSGKFPI